MTRNPPWRPRCVPRIEIDLDGQTRRAIIAAARRAVSELRPAQSLVEYVRNTSEIGLDNLCERMMQINRSLEPLDWSDLLVVILQAAVPH